MNITSYLPSYNKYLGAIIGCLGFLFLVVLPHAGLSQNDLAGATTEWRISQHQDVDSKKMVNKESIMILTSDGIAWGPNKDELMPMTILSKKGKWDKITNRGKVTYKIDMEGGPGTATIKGNAKGIVIIFKITHSNGASHLRLTCNDVSYE